MCAMVIDIYTDEVVCETASINHAYLVAEALNEHYAKISNADAVVRYEIVLNF